MKPLEQRAYQDRVVNKALGFIRAGDTSVMIESPTGSGKTIMCLRICQYLEREYGWRTNWVAMRRNLLSQVAVANEQYFGMEKLTTVSMFEKDPPPCDITVVDEAQHDATASAAHIHAHSGSKIIIGLSATPYRTDTLKLAFRRVIRDAGIHRLITDGWLSPYRHWSIDSWDVARVASVYLGNQKQWGKSVVFFHRISQCREFAKILADAGHHCEVITADTDRETQLEDFDAGRFGVVANVAILNEGFDCPELCTVFVRDSAKLPTIQMAGRAFRKSPGKSHCNIIQSGSAKWQFTRTAGPIESYVMRDEKWLTLGKSVEINDIARAAVRRLAQLRIVIPPYLTSQAQSRRRGIDRRQYGRWAREDEVAV